MLIDSLQQENLDMFTSTVGKIAFATGRPDSRGPIVNDLMFAQALAFDDKTGANVTPALIQFFDMVEDRDPDTGEVVVTPGRPFLQAEDKIVQPAHQYRFKTNGGYRLYLGVRLLMAAVSMNRTPDELTKIAMTMEELVPPGYHPQYRALAGTIQSMARTSTPMRVTGKEEQRARIQKQQRRRLQRAGR